MKTFGIGLALFTGAYTESFAQRGFWGIALYVLLIVFAVTLTSNSAARFVRRLAERWEREMKEADE